MLRAAISEHTGQNEAPWPANLPTASYGAVSLDRSVSVMDAVASLFPGEGIVSKQPKIMEEYDQGHGMILYTTEVSGKKLSGGASLDFGGPVHDYAHVSFESLAYSYGRTDPSTGL
jgi:beta-galactosidase